MRLFSALNISLAWCVLGYYLLDRAEVTGSILASMAAITTASFGRSFDVSGRLIESPSVHRFDMRFDPSQRTRRGPDDQRGIRCSISQPTSIMTSLAHSLAQQVTLEK